MRNERMMRGIGHWGLGGWWQIKRLRKFWARKSFNYEKEKKGRRTTNNGVGWRNSEKITVGKAQFHQKCESI